MTVLFIEGIKSSEKGRVDRIYVIQKKKRKRKGRKDKEKGGEEVVVVLLCVWAGWWVWCVFFSLCIFTGGTLRVVSQGVESEMLLLCKTHIVHTPTQNHP